MEINIKVSPSVRLTRKLDLLQRLDVVREAADAVTDYLRRYHTEFSDKWRGSRYMSGGNSGQFAESVVAGWQNPIVSTRTATIKNTFGLLKWKVTGGTITAKNAKYLTIPLIPDAKGVSARQFSLTGDKLFKAGNALCRKIGKRLEAVYALKESVEQEPWPGAMPDDEALREIFTRSAKQQIERVINA